MKIEIDREKHKITILDCPALVLDEYNDDMYGELPKGPIVDNTLTHKRSTDIFEWLYNNEHQFGGMYLNASGANNPQVLGSAKIIWKQFERDSRLVSDDCINIDEMNINELQERFWQYYFKNHKNKFENALSRFRDYVKRQRLMLSDEYKHLEHEQFPFLSDDVWENGCYSYLKHLIKRNSTKGYCYELILLKAIHSIINDCEIRESTSDEEKRGIDGIVIINGEEFPLSLKPITYTSAKHSRVYEDRLIMYQKVKKDGEFLPDAIEFVFKSGFDIIK